MSTRGDSDSSREAQVARLASGRTTLEDEIAALHREIDRFRESIVEERRKQFEHVDEFLHPELRKLHALETIAIEGDELTADEEAERERLVALLFDER